MWKKQEAEQQLEEQRKGPFDVLATHASLKLSGVKLSVHHIRVKRD